MSLPTDIASCHQMILLLQNQVGELRKQNALLTSRVDELEDRLNKNSQNSNKPPSSDGLRKKPVKRPAFAKKKGKKAGGQEGHQGKTLEFCVTPDFVEEHLPKQCGCGEKLDKTTARVIEKRQVFDLPEPKLEVTEHQKLTCTCSKCGEINEGVFPDGVNAHVQYGTGIRALVVLLNIAFKLPLKKIRTLFGDLYGYAINDSTIINAVKRCYTNLESSETVIKKNILQSIVAHFDETGLRVVGKLHWLHVCSTKLHTYFFIHANRGMKALEDVASLLPHFKNWAIHDCWRSYFKFTECSHGLCGAHIIRELFALEEKESQWASWFRRYLFALYNLSEKGTKTLNANQQKKALLVFEKIWENANKIEPLPQKSKSGRGKPKATKGRNLLIRLQKHQAALLAFAFHQEIPFTNNQAERDLRPAKIKQKIAGSFRTFGGAESYARIFGFISTTRKNQLSVFKELIAAFNGYTFLTEDKTS